MFADLEEGVGDGRWEPLCGAWSITHSIRHRRKKATYF